MYVKPLFTVTSITCTALLALLIAYKKQGLQDRQRYRHNSTAPVRKNGRAVWFVDGKDYMFAVADAIELAKLEIMIMDWQMNPEILMKRSETGVDNLKWRLDNILLRKADQGVKVFILLYWEPKTFLDLGSDHVVKLLGKHENIEIHRHPDTLRGGASLLPWSHHEKMIIIDRRTAFIGGIDLAYGRWDTRNHELMDNYPVYSAVNETKAGEDSFGRYTRWIGKDYRNTLYNKEKEADEDQPFKDYEGVDRNKIPRMPWHDVSCAFTGEAVNDAVKHFLERYNILKPWWRINWDSFGQYFANSFAWTFFSSRKSEAEKTVLKSNVYDVDIQLLRSVAKWSAGQEHEDSIYNAYLDMIKNAEHFIYIENQFFILSQDGFRRIIQRRIQSALVERIVRAHKIDETFHVFVITPQRPEFLGDLDWKNLNADALEIVRFFNQVTIFDGEHSLFAKLKEQNISNEIAKKYVSVYSLRTHDLIGKQFVTEIVYVHSKIMIVDDRKAIIGSANINDRSMLGDRDSEVAVIIEDLDMIDGKIKGSDYKFGKFAHSLRCDLMKEHLGIFGNKDDELGIKMHDPVATSFIKGVASRAKDNTDIFITVFGPTMFQAEDREDIMLKRYPDIPLSREDTAIGAGFLADLKGNLVKYPCPFLTKGLSPLALDYNYMFDTSDEESQDPNTNYYYYV